MGVTAPWLEEFETFEFNRKTGADFGDEACEIERVAPTLCSGCMRWKEDGDGQSTPSVLAIHCSLSKHIAHILHMTQNELWLEHFRV